MPRGARLDTPGTLHHVMVRGIEGNRIVVDDDDRHLFVSRLGIAAAVTASRSSLALSVCQSKDKLDWRQAGSS
jgi:hypothetical protein